MNIYQEKKTHVEKLLWIALAVCFIVMWSGYEKIQTLQAKLIKSEYKMKQVEKAVQDYTDGEIVKYLNGGELK